MLSVDFYLRRCVEIGGSDVHFKTDSGHVYIRVNGDLQLVEAEPYHNREFRTELFKHLKQEQVDLYDEELELDFAEEDVEFADRTQFKALVERITLVLKRLIDSFAVGNVIKNGIPVAIVGEPNVGKSTLLNALLNEERAIVSEIAGTTRDTIEDEISIGGIGFRFIDTAGLRHTNDVIEKIGVEKAKQKISEAQIVLLVVDISEKVENIILQYTSLELRADQNCIIVLNKIDAISSSNGYDIEEAVATLTKVNTLAISAKNKLRVDKLVKQIITTSSIDKITNEGTIITNARHYNELNNALQSLQEISNGLANNLSGDLISVDIKKALSHIASLTGNVEHDKDILGTIFGKFCIGK